MPHYPMDARADLVGPTVDSNAEQSVPVFREETHQLQAAAAPGISLRMKPRPPARRISHQLQAGSTLVRHRVSNQNPASAGNDEQTTIWGVSDPWQRSHLSNDPEQPATHAKLTLVGLGIGIGIGLHLLAHSR